MTEKEKELLNILKREIDSDDFIGIAYEVIDKIKETENPFKYVEPSYYVKPKFVDFSGFSQIFSSYNRAIGDEQSLYLVLIS